MNGETYLQTHGIAEQFALDQGLAWTDEYLNIPIKDEDGELLFLKARNLKYGDEGNTAPKYKNPAGSTATLFNWHLAKEALNIFLCEGEMDALKLTEEGIPAISSTGGAGTFKPDWADLIKGKNLWICMDNDPAGNAGTRSLLELLPNATVVKLPEGAKDICEYFSLGCTKKEFLALPTFNKENWLINNRPPEYDLLSAEDYKNKEFAIHPWLIENIIYSEGFAFIYGAEGTGKSYLALSMADAIASGTPWLDKFPTTKGNVLFLDKENPHSLIKKRLEGLGMDQDNIYFLEHPEKFQLTDFTGEASPFALALSEIIIEKQIDFIVIDSFVDLVVGSENSSADTQAFFNAIRELYPRIAYLPLHHENKPSQGVSRTASQRLRGSSNINAQTFTMFRLEAVAKSKTEMTLKQTKARDSLKLDKFMIRMIVKNLANGTTTISGFEYIGEVLDNEDGGLDDSKLEEVEETIKRTIAENTFITRQNALEIGANLGASKSTISRAIASLLKDGEVSKGRKGREVIYQVNMFDSNDVIEELSTPIV